MTQAQVDELDQSLTTALRSTTIEWAVNLRICDMLQANPTLAEIAMGRIRDRLRKESPVPVLLALSLLEMVVKNCGMSACRFVGDDLAEALVSLVKKRQTWWYGLGRNLHKSGMSTWLPQGASIDEGDRKMWQQASSKVLEMLQLWTDAFMLHEAQLRPVFGAYKELRKDGYRFPRSSHGTSTGLQLIAGAEESPAFLAGACPGGAGSSGGDGGVNGYSAPGVDAGAAAPEAAAEPPRSGRAAPSETPAPLSAEGGAGPPRIVVPDGSGSLFDGLSVASPSGAAAAGPAPVSPAAAAAAEGPQGGAEGDLAEARRALGALQLLANPWDPALRTPLLADLRRSRDAILRRVEDAAGDGDGAPDEDNLAAMLVTLEELNDALGSSGAEATGGGEQAGGSSGSSAGPVPPPPTDAPPDREQQEQYDLMLARYLQERENEAFLAGSAAIEEQDAAFARRLAMEEGTWAAGSGVVGQARHASPVVAACMQCGTLNQLQPTAQGRRRGRFVCHACGFTQSAPGPHPGLSSLREDRPARHAPPARVICSSGAAPELLIGGGAGGESEEGGDPLRSDGVGAGAGAAAAKPGYGIASGTDLSKGLLSGSDTGGGEAPVLGRSVKALASSVGALASSAVSSSSSSVRRLGDGLPSAEYASMDGDSPTGATLLGGPPSKKRSSRTPGAKLLSSLTGKHRRSSDNEESLLERVHVTGAWELIRPTDGRPYWFNSETETSQWEPPEVVRRAAK